MAITYPTTIDSLTNPTAANTQDSPSHSTQHSDLNDIVEALEAKVGVNSSAVAASIDYLLKNTSSSNPGHKHTLANSATDVTASAAEVNILDGCTANYTELNVLDGIPGTLTATELGYVDGVTSAIQTQINTKAPSTSATLTTPTINQATITGPKVTLTTATDAATVTFNLSNGPIHTVTLGGNRTLAVSNSAVGKAFMLRLKQDGTGSRTVTWFATINWDSDTAPTLSTSASFVDVYGFVCTAADTYDGYVVAEGIDES